MTNLRMDQNLHLVVTLVSLPIYLHTPFFAIYFDFNLNYKYNTCNFSLVDIIVFIINLYI